MVNTVPRNGISKYYPSTNPVLPQYYLSNNPVLAQYYLSTISVLSQYYLSTNSVLTHGQRIKKHNQVKKYLVYSKICARANVRLCNEYGWLFDLSLTARELLIRESKRRADQRQEEYLKSYFLSINFDS